MAGLKGGNDALGTGKQLEAFEAFVVRGVGELQATFLPIIGMLGSDRGVIQSGRDGMRAFDLPFYVHEDVGHAPLQHAEPPAGETGGMFAAGDAPAAGFDAD
jgi:hypothetical protein